jgi:hypothetical protein
VKWRALRAAEERRPHLKVAAIVLKLVKEF